MTILTSGALAYNTIEEQAHANVYNLINTKTNVADPLGTNKRKMVYSREPNSMGRSFEGYPYIIVKPAAVAFDGYTKGLVKARLVGSIPIVIRSSDNVPGKFKDHGNELVTDLVNDIIKVIHSNKALFITYKMANLAIKFEPTELIDIDEDEVYEKNGEVTFEDMIKVIA